MYRLAEADLTLVLLANSGDEEAIDAVFADVVRVAVAAQTPAD
jgi:hypothetical protein